MYIHVTRTTSDAGRLLREHSRYESVSGAAAGGAFNERTPRGVRKEREALRIAPGRRCGGALPPRLVDE